MFQRKNTTDLLILMRNLLRTNCLDAYIIPMGDAHNNEYLAACDHKVEYITGFTGSAGLVVITMKKAALWTDGRYYEQAENQIDENWILMKTGQPNTPTLVDWLNEEISSDGLVGFYKNEVTMDFYQQILKGIRPRRSIQMLNECLVSAIWPDRPSRPSNPLIILPESFTGSSWRLKIDSLRQKLLKENVFGILISALDEIAWLFNMRGSDITHNPVFFSYCFVTEKEIHLFLNHCNIDQSEELKKYLCDEDLNEDDNYNTQIHHYNNIDANLIAMTESCPKILLDNRTVCGIVLSLPEEKRHMASSPVSLMKAVKCDEEIKGMQQCSIEDSVALCQYFNWLENEVAADRPVTEAGAALELDRLRSLLPGFFSLSFDTISCSGRNGGLVHYRAVLGQDAPISSKETYLCDSGGQYLTGTTDVTRTVHFGQPSPDEKTANTLVLQGHIALASVVFPEGTLGTRLDAIARMHLWRRGLDYRHGTGHGVGAFLNVHEGPCGLSGARIVAGESGLRGNMVLTIEPGFYRPGSYGIRIENAYFLTAATVDARLSDPSVTFLRFEPLTYFPIQTKLIDIDLMAASDIDWVNRYHVQCRERLGAVLLARRLVDEHRWLLRETEPI